MRRANSGQPTGNDLPAFRHKLREQTNVFVVDVLDLLDAELADFLPPEILAAALAASRSAGPARTWTSRPRRTMSVALTFRWRATFRPCAWCFRLFSHDAPSRLCGAGTLARGL